MADIKYFRAFSETSEIFDNGNDFIKTIETNNKISDVQPDDDPEGSTENEDFQWRILYLFLRSSLDRSEQAMPNPLLFFFLPERSTQHTKDPTLTLIRRSEVRRAAYLFIRT